MNNTPETDAQGFGDGRHPWVGTDFARKLKRERDEARTELEMWRDGNILHEIHRDELEKVERERDDARELLASEKITRNHIIKRSVEVEQERDEAREENAKLRNIAERAINYLDQSYRDGFADEVSDLRYEIEQLKKEAK